MDWGIMAAAAVLLNLEMGGGKFLMMTALMNVLGLLAKVYLRLTAPGDFSTDEHRKIVKESRDLVADSLPELKNDRKKRLDRMAPAARGRLQRGAGIPETLRRSRPNF